MELTGSVSTHEVEAGVLVESGTGDFLATLPDDVEIDVRASGAHVEGVVHRFVEFAIPLESLL